MDGPGEIMDAEEYLQPTMTNGTTTSNSSTNGTLQRNPQDASWPDDSPQNFHNRYRERQRYGGGRVPSIGESRYCSDPLNILGKDMGDGFYSDGTKSRQANVGNLKLDLPVDDDDYLMPSPQNNKNSTAYLDVVGDPNSKHTGLF